MTTGKTFIIAAILIANSLLHAQGPTLEWAESMGSSNGDLTASVAVDPSGNAISTGQYIGLVDFDPGPGTFNLGNANSGIPDVFVQKVNSAGQLIWACSFGGNSYDIPSGVETDVTGAVYVVGHFDGTCDFDPGPGIHNVSPVTGTDMFILKLDSAGNFRWVQTFNSTGGSSDFAIGIARGIQNTMVISGTIYGSCDFDAGPGSYVLSYADSMNENIFLLCLDTAGQISWARGIGGNGWDECGYEVKCDPNGNVYLTGLFSGTVDFDPGPGTYPLTSQSGTQNIFALKLDAGGMLVYADVFLSSCLNEGLGIACTATGEAIITGVCCGSTDFDPGPGTSNVITNGLNDIFICKLDAVGNLDWVKNIGGSTNDAGRTMTIDANGNIYTAGDFCGTVDFDPGAGVQSLTAYSPPDVFILKLDSSGNFVWVTRLGSTASEYCMSIKLDAVNSVYTAGWFGGVADFDPSSGTYNITPQATDGYVQKYNQCSVSTTFMSDTACYQYTLNNQTYTTSGIYIQLLTANSGCDSIIQLGLTINTVDVSVTVNDPTMTANAIGATYQWINCENGFVIPGATSQSFTPALNGTYAVVVTQNNCSDTSVCNMIVGVGVTESTDISLFRISENPNHGTFTVLLNSGSAADIMIYDAQGKLVSTQKVQSNSVQIKVGESGMYMITVITADGQRSTQRVIVSE